MMGRYSLRNKIPRNTVGVPVACLISTFHGQFKTLILRRKVESNWKSRNSVAPREPRRTNAHKRWQQCRHRPPSAWHDGCGLGVSVTHNAWQNIPKREILSADSFGLRIPVFTRYPPPDFSYLNCTVCGVSCSPASLFPVPIWSLRR